MWERFVVLLVWLVQQVGRKIFFHLVKEGWNACCDEPFRQQIKKILRFIGSLPIFVLALVPTVLAGTSVFVLVVFLATLLEALLNLALLLIFSVSNGVYASLLPALIPQALVNALIASLVFSFPLPAVEEAR